jgi:transcriptional regulator with XRE-family HTH domain
MVVFSKERLVLLRTRFELTQEELASKIGVSKKQVSAWETGPTEPRNDSVVALARFFNVTTDFLLGVTDNEKGHLSKSDLTPEQLKVLAAYDRGDMLELIDAVREDVNKRRKNR